MEQISVTKKISWAVIGFALFTGIIACEEVPITIPEFELPSSERTVLIEDLTGVQCTNCPKGAAAIEEILTTFKGKAFAVGIHGVQQAGPLAESKYDFRNEFASKLEVFHRPFLGKPSAAINRRKFDNEDNIPIDNVGVWSLYVQNELTRALEANIQLAHTYNPATRQLQLETATFPLISENGDYRLSVFVTESEIEDVQEDQGVIVENYIHMHVLRHMMTNFDGDQIATIIKKGDSFKKNFSYTIPTEFNDKHMEVVVAFHRNGASGQDRSVLQTAGFKLMP